MNRRTFISTLTALAGVVLAKFKAPPKDYLAVTATGTFTPDNIKDGIKVWEWVQVSPGRYTYRERIVSNDELNAEFDAIVSRVSGRTHCWAKQSDCG